MSPKDPNEIGALWERESTHGVYMSGEIAGQRVVVFRNDKATGKQPQWRVLKAKEDGPPTRTPHDANAPDEDFF